MNDEVKPKRTRSAAVISAVVVDLVCVIVFAVLGKAVHDEHRSWWYFFVIVWPFVVALLVSHDVVWRMRMSSRKVAPGGILILLATYIVGMALRALTGGGMAIGFMIVAAVFLLVTMIGWRFALLGWQGRKG